MIKLILYLYAALFLGSNADMDNTPVALAPLPAATPQLEPVADTLLHARKNLPETPRYQADAEPETLYFDADGLPVEAAAQGGYYRKILGKSADGRLAVQDFYQDNDQAQTGISLLGKDADPADFSFDPVDSKTVWYRADGSIKFIADMQAGKLTGYYNHYLDNLLIAQYDLGTADDISLAELPGWGRIDSATFYPDGRYMIAFVQGETEPLAVYFRADGSPLVALYLNHFDPDNPREDTYRAWQADGSAANWSDVEQDVQAMEPTLTARWEQYQNDL